MRSYDVSVDVTGRVNLEGELKMAVTAHLPDKVDQPVPVLVGYPGGGYSRGYYDIRRLPGYSQAQFHTERGFVFVACDHLGVGDSSFVDDTCLNYEIMAEANHLTLFSVIDGLQGGWLIKGVEPLEIETVVGVGHSMGACLLAVQQAHHCSFDAIAVLGYSCIRPSFPTSGGRRIVIPSPPRDSIWRAMALAKLGSLLGQKSSVVRYCFHAEDEEPELVEADMSSSSKSGLPQWRTARVPSCAMTMMSKGAVAREAAAIDVPVLVACGEIDVVTDPSNERSAYPCSGKVSVTVVPRMCHMHNFARTRELLWERIERFVHEV